MSSVVPLEVLLPGSSRQTGCPAALLAPVLTRLFPVPWVHSWVVAPDLQAASTTPVPDAVAPPAVPRHSLLIWRVCPVPSDQFCSGSLAQVAMATEVPDCSRPASTHIGVPVSEPPSSMNMPDGIGPPAVAEVVAAVGNTAFSAW